jgi:casein kinase II subunit beta
MFVFNEIITRNAKASRGEPPHDANAACSDWVSDFLQRNNWLCIFDEAYVNDNFNLYGLSTQVDDYQNALRVVRGQFAEPNARLEKRAEDVYGLMHARYILTFQGTRKMLPKYEIGLFGACPRIACNGQALLPIGLDPVPGRATVKGFCPCCQDVYDLDHPLDGAYFGPYFAHFFLQAEKTDMKTEAKVPPPLSAFGIPIDDDSRMLSRNRLVHPGGFSQ